jgi:hypothetical protein
VDEYVEKVLIPNNTRGTLRKRNPEYVRTVAAISRARKRGDRALVRRLRRRLRAMPSVDPRDPDYRRLRYTRYADDQLLGLTGPKAEAERIKDQLAAFLREDLGLELSPDKTLITHARTRAARFLGYEIIVQHADNRITCGRRMTNGVIALRVPLDVITAKCAPYLRRGKPAHRSDRHNLDDYDIVRIFGAEYRGVVQYYLLAVDVWRLSRLRWAALTSMLKTLAAKHHSTVTAMVARYRATTDTVHGKRRCFEARIERAGKQPLVARFGGIPLARNKAAVLTDRSPVQGAHPRKELIARLLKGRCELCGQSDKMVVHQVRTLASLGTPESGQPAWAALMSRKRRKTLIVCRPCHETIHATAHANTA